MATANSADLLVTTLDIVKLHLAHATVSPDGVPGLIKEVYEKLEGLQSFGGTEAQKPAVPISESVSPDGQWVVCLEDGKRFKMMKRHLRTVYNMSPDEYRAKWGLAPDHPVVAPAYHATKSAYARNIGLGTVKLGRGKRRRKPTAASLLKVSDVKQTAG